MAKEGLGQPGYYRCCSLCGAVMMIFWTLVGFVAGLVVGAVAIRSDFFRDFDVLGGVAQSERGGDNHVNKPICQVTSESSNGYNITRGHCSGCEGARSVCPWDACTLPCDLLSEYPITPTATNI